MVPPTPEPAVPPLAPPDAGIAAAAFALRRSETIGRFAAAAVD